ncbi:MAG TPA: hypothetical protein VM165_24080 [Planctomycetaceae bacterium]|nr:hypothetical protein [Planctomycetaceae bacterium]
MIPTRRLTFQLIPLLDLLLIVVFSQYLESRVATEQQQVEAAATQSLLSAQLDEALRQLLALKERLTQMDQQMQVAELRGGEADRFRAQRDLIGELVTELFRLPEGSFTALSQATGPGPSANDLAQLQARLKALAGGQSNRVVDHLLTFGEMRKRIDVWELYLQDNGAFVLTVGDKRLSFRAETAEDFATRLFEAYKTLPEPKSLVLLLVSYGDVKFQPLKAALDGLPAALDRIRIDAGTRSRLDYAVLGFRPQSPNTNR